MYGMKEVCEKTGLTYETLKFYCNQGLIPNVKRDEKNRRVFDDRDIAWITGLQCLRNCNLGIQEMKEYLNLCLQGPSSLEERLLFLDQKKENLQQSIAELQKGLDYIENKQQLYRDMIDGKVPYRSNLIKVD